MNNVVIQVDRLSKEYRLGIIGRKRLVDDVNRWWARFRGKEDPLSKVGQPKAESRKQKPESPRLAGSNSPISALNSHPSERYWALKDVSFEVEQGEVLGIIGRNGAGKSTLLKILSRVTGPTSGEVRVKGRIASLLEVGTGFHPELTGRENVFLNGAILGMTKAEIREKFDEIVDFSEIEEFIDTPVKRYSSGMYVRLAFAVAAHLEPEILIVDEVLAVGDAQFQKKCLGKMESVSGKEGRTILFVSHQIAAITRLCKKVLWLDGGKAKDYGPADLICSEYLANGSSASAKREWKNGERAPGNEWVRLINVEARAEGKVADQLGINQPVEIRMDYEVLREGKVLIPNIHLFAEDGTLIFIAHDWYSGWRTRPKPLGKYKTKFNIPGNFFSEGRITIKVVISTYRPFEVHFVEPDAIAFTVVESDSGDRARGDYAGPLPGVVRPLIATRTEVIES
jgi:lipopolysaccharide transport system ATP-binding protein